jgi:hypothetical protein
MVSTKSFLVCSPGEEGRMHRSHDSTYSFEEAQRERHTQLLARFWKRETVE